MTWLNVARATFAAGTIYMLAGFSGDELAAYAMGALAMHVVAKDIREVRTSEIGHPDRGPGH